MANPISSALRRVTKHPLPQSTINRIILIVFLVVGLISVFGVIGGYRESSDISAYKALGVSQFVEPKYSEISGV